MHKMRQDQSSGYSWQKGMAINYRQCPKCGSNNSFLSETHLGIQEKLLPADIKQELKAFFHSLKEL